MHSIKSFVCSLIDCCQIASKPEHWPKPATSFCQDSCPENVLSILGQTLGPLAERTIKNQLESRVLAQIRDLLLPKLMSGEIRLRNAEESIEAVA